MATVEGVDVGDKVIAIDGRKTATMTRGQLLAALHGAPGEHRKLLLGRGGKTVGVEVVVTPF